MTLSRNQRRQEKRRMYGEQEGRCAHCEHKFPIHGLEIDHIVPTSKGGADVPSNWQLLCSGCNRSKGDRDNEYAQTRLKEAAKKDPERVDFPVLASSPNFPILQSDDGYFVLTDGIDGDAIPFDTDVWIDGVHYECEVRDFSHTDDRGFLGRTYTFQGLKLPYHVFDGVTERFAIVKVEYSVSAPVVGTGKTRKYSPFWFYWDRDDPLTIRYCDVIRPSEDPRKHPIEYNTKGKGKQ